MPRRCFGLTEPFAGTLCTGPCRNPMPSGTPPNVRTHVRFEDQDHQPADRRRRPPHRLRNPGRVRAGARWENSPGLRGSARRKHAPAPHRADDASQRPQRPLHPRRGIRPVPSTPDPPRPACLKHPVLRPSRLFEAEVAYGSYPKSGPRLGASPRRSESKRSGHGEGRRVAALRKPLAGAVARRYQNEIGPRLSAARTSRRTGGDLLSQGVAPQVPSALKGLTALFGMGRGVSLSLCATGILRDATPGGA